MCPTLNSAQGGGALISCFTMVLFVLWEIKQPRSESYYKGSKTGAREHTEREKQGQRFTALGRG